MDLARPESEEIIEQYIEKFSFLDGEIFKNDFRNSLRAAFTKEELEEIVEISDRDKIINMFL